MFDLVSEVKSKRLHKGFYSGNVVNFWGRYFWEHVQVTSYYICTVTSRKNSNIWNAVNINQVMTITFEFFIKPILKVFVNIGTNFGKLIQRIVQKHMFSFYFTFYNKNEEFGSKT